MRRTGDHAEIMNCNSFVDYLHEFGDFFSRLHRDLIVRFNRVHMDDGITAELCRKLFFNIVYHIVRFEQILIGGNLRVKGDHPSARTVIVNDEVVKTEDPLVRHDGFAYFVDEFIRRRDAEKRVYRLLCGAQAGYKNEERNSRPADTIKVKAREFCYEHTYENDHRRNAVAEAVRRSRFHRGRGNLLSNFAVITAHIELDKH